MVWYNLQIGKFLIKYTPLKADESEYPICDSEGNLLNKVSDFENKTNKSYYVNDKNERVEVIFRLINGKPRAKLDKTKNVSNFKEVDKNEVEDLLSEKEYLVESDFLLDELKNTNKCLKFAFTNGNGYKVFKAYIYVDNLYDMLFMKLGRTQKSELLGSIKELQKNKQQAEQLQLKIQGVDKAKVEDLIEI